MEVIGALDYKIMTYIVEFLRTDVATAVMRFFSFLGDHGLLWIAVGVVLLCTAKTRRFGVALLLALLLAVLLSEYGVKFLVARARPFITHPTLVPLITPPSGYSFPSSHATTAFACAAVLFCMRKSVGIVAGLVAMFIAISRVYLCVHYPSDVLVGMLLGVVVGVLVAWLTQRIAQQIHYARLR